MTNTINSTLGSDSATTIHRVGTGILLSGILTTTAGHTTEEYTDIRATTDIGIDGIRITMDTAMVMDLIPTDTIMDIRTSYTATPQGVEGQGTQDIVVPVGPLVSEVVQVHMEDQREAR